MPVAKSFQSFEQLTEPYEKNGRFYVKVKNPNSGAERQVRWYSDREYARMYGEKVEKTETASKTEYIDNRDPRYWTRPQKDVLGFLDGYITIFKGDTYAHKMWLKEHIVHYTRWWGWYLFSNETLPEDFPEDLTPVRLDWEVVGQENGLLKLEEQIIAGVEKFRYEPSKSQHIGNIKDRLELTLTVKKNILLEGAYGISHLHVFEDANENEFVWITASKSLAESKTYRLRGTVKDHTVYKGSNQTVLTRCSNIEEIE